MTLKVFDCSLGWKRPATQEDIDQMQAFITSVQLRPEGRLITDGDSLFEDFDFKLALYPNRMRPDGAFVAELKEIEPYRGITGMRGEAIYPSLPDTANRIGCQLPNKFAAELVRRWNASIS